MEHQGRGAAVRNYQVSIPDMALRGVARRLFSSSALEEKYPGSLAAAHWVMAGGFLGCIGTVLASQQTPKADPMKGQLMFAHKSMGTLMAALVLPRAALRLTSVIPAAVPGPAWERAVANVSHLALYAGMFALPMSGVAMGYFGGKGLPFFWTTIPGAQGDAKRGKWAGQAFKIHKTVGTYWKYLPLVHFGAVGVHFAKGQNILKRML